MKEKNLQRFSNFELLRIVCMVFIVIYHMVGQTAISNLHIDERGYWFFAILGVNGRWACNCFVMLGAYFLVDKSFKAERIVNLWLQIFMYSVSITIICIVFGWGGNLIYLVQSMLPIFGRPIWFGAEYLCLLIFSPFLNILLKEENVLICKKILIIIGILIIGCATVFPIEHTAPVFSELVWFSFLYLLVGYIKKQEPVLLITNTKKRIGGGILVFVIGLFWIVFCKVIADYTQSSFIQGVSKYYIEHYEALPGVLCSFAIFLCFMNIRVKYNRFINLVSGSCFAVYLIHQQWSFLEYMWNGVFQVDYMVETGNIMWYAIVVTIVLFGVAIIVESIRKIFMKRLVYSTKFYKKVCDKLERIAKV